LRSTSALPLLAVAIFAACADTTPTALDPSALSAASAKKDAPNAQASVTVVMSGLNNPRGLEWGPDGALYVAEAGTTTINGVCAAVPRGQFCYSGTGSISRLWKGDQDRIVTGLPSLVVISPAGAVGDVTGPHDIAFQGNGNGYVTIGWGGPPAARAAFGALAEGFASVIHLKPNDQWSVEADIGTYENVNNPAGGPLDSNPFGALSDGGRRYVADAGGNTIYEVSPNGAISVVATLPPTASGADAVPTEVVRGPDGALYVSQLTGFPFTAGAAAVWRIAPGGTPEVYRSGFKTITDLHFGPDGTLYVLQIASGPFLSGPGILYAVRPNEAPVAIASNLVSPTGVLAGPDGALYVSNRGTTVGTGEVLRIVP
jgi:glucose/arabinose dehydrogenase